MKTNPTAPINALPMSWPRPFLPLLLALAMPSMGIQPMRAQTSGVPGFISYQGRVLDSTGSPVGIGTPANRTVIFRIWDHPSNVLAPNLIYSEQQTVTIADGEFSVLVGQGVATTGSQFGYSETPKGPPASIANAFGGSGRYLGVTVDDGTAAIDNEITPRQQIVTTAFAFRAKEAEMVVDSSIGTGSLADGSVTLLKMATGSVNSSSIVDNSITTADLANGGVTAAKLGADVGLWSVNGGDVYRAAGNVGIGLTNPSMPLVVSGGGNGTTAQLTSAQDHVGLHLRNTGAGGVDWSLQSTGGASGNGQGKLLFATGSGMGVGFPVTLQSNGDVGIGTTSPMVKLHVAGKARIDSGLAGPPTVGIDGGAGYRLVLWPVTPTEVPYGLGIAAANMWSAVPAGSFHSWYGGTTELMRVLSDGRFGLGVSSLLPNFQFQVKGPPNLSNWEGAAIFSGNEASVVFGELDGDIGGPNPGVATIGGHNATGTAWANLAINPGGGSVGIGTTTPTRAKLQVEGNAGSSGTNNHGYLFVSGATTQGAITEPASIYASNAIHCQHVRAYSDERIKNIRGVSDGRSDLSTLLGIEITDYTMKDTVGKGAAAQKMVIAQQVEKVYPVAVAKTVDMIPDIYQKASIKGGWVELPTGLKEGERVRLIAEKADGIYEVLEVGEGRFRTAFKPDGKDVFVFGREVNDYRVVDYDAIAMLNVSATQQIKKETDTELGALREENAELRTRLAALEAKDAARDARLLALEELLTTERPVSRTVSVNPAPRTE